LEGNAVNPMQCSLPPAAPNASQATAIQHFVDDIVDGVLEDFATTHATGQIPRILLLPPAAPVPLDRDNVKRLRKMVCNLSSINTKATIAFWQCHLRRLMLHRLKMPVLPTNISRKANV
jgi:hypothetical protein